MPDETAWALTDEEAQALQVRGDFFAAGALRGTGVSVPMRHARGIANFLAHCELLPYDGQRLYPAGGTIWREAEPQTVRHFYVQVETNPGLAEQREANAASPVEREAYRKVCRFCADYPKAGGYTHSIINFGRVLAEGLDAYAERIGQRLAATEDAEQQELYRALLVVVEAVDAYRARLADYLEGLSSADPERERNRQRLAAAYCDRLPMRQARGFFEAMVASIFLYAIDGSDDLGRFDQFMWPYFREDFALERVTREEAVELVRELWRYVDDCDGWNVALGGATRDGREASNALTLVCLEAAQGRRRPNLALRLRQDTPDAVWDAALDVIATGNGLPALYCEENYLRAIDLAGLNLAEEDKRDFAFGGCTELMVHGCSNVGSLDGDFSVIKTLEESLHRHLPACAAFEEFFQAFAADLRAGIAALTAAIDRHQEVRATRYPQVIRTLLIDDCIDRGRNYHNGGARCNWSVINIVGLSNAIDALAALRQLVYEERSVSAEELLAALRADYAGYEDLRGRLLQSPKFGNDDPAVDALAHRLSGLVFREFKRYAPWRGGRYLPATLMFVTYGWFGQPVGATPDGRAAGTPVSDSAGPVQGRDRHGPTAMLRSVAGLQHQHAPGTLVVNIRLARAMFATPAGREQVKSLIRAYFALGGMQLQINVVDQAVLRDAIAHPERHGNLVVRVGGYSEYFTRLDGTLQHSLLERTEHQ
ncbi:MAG: pyruvate formate lyase family protein [Armatimonadota bacterium]